MENKRTARPSIFSSCLLSVIMSLIGLSALFFGFIYLIGSANADPFDNLESKSAIVLQGELVALFTVLYLVFCLVALFFWYRRGHSWNYVILGLGLFHLIGSTYLAFSRDWESDLTRLYLYSSVIMNLILIAVTISDRKRFRESDEKKNA